MVPVAALHGHVGLVDRHDHPLRLDVFQHHRLQQAKSRAHVARAAIEQHQRQVHELPGLAAHGDFTLEFVDDVFGVLQISRLAIAQPGAVMQAQKLMQAMRGNALRFRLHAIAHLGHFHAKHGIERGAFARARGAHQQHIQRP